MRIYADFPEAINEIRRELKEMGIRIHTKSVQNQDITANSNFDSLEIQNYTYTVTNPDWHLISLRDPAWATAEFQERTGGQPLNPGFAWKYRKDYWEQFLNSEGKFDYAYPERLEFPLQEVISALKKDPLTRRAFMAVFDASQDRCDDFDCRLPCTLGYWLNFRQGKLNLTYLQRSSDFSEHFNYDIYLATRMKDYVAEQVGMEPGTFTHWLGSLHIFQKDVAGVF